jgi:rod shape-determining protein MreD
LYKVRYYIDLSINTLWLALLFYVQMCCTCFLYKFSIRLNLDILFIMSIAASYNVLYASTLGFVLGLLHDELFGKFIGCYAILYMLISYFTNRLFKYFLRNSYAALIMLCFIITNIFELITALISFSFKRFCECFPYVMCKIILPEALYNAILISLVYASINCVKSRIKKH